MAAEPDQVEDAISAIAAASEVLARDARPGVQLVGAWLAEGGDAALFAFLTGSEATRGPSARLAAAIARRDSLIVAAVELAFTGLPIGQQADSMSAALRSYASTAWPRDRLRTAGNPHPPDTLRGALFEVLRLRDRPLSPVQIARIIRSDRMHADRV